MRQDRIRNFSIVAHIDHGKSTLADRLLLKSGAITEREFREQILDDMDLERERGITIKARTATFMYNIDGEEYVFNLIDTPGHVDFSYEVTRSLRACEGALLVVDASQGVEAQTVVNAYLAIDVGLEILPVLNKIDLGHARIDECLLEIESAIGLETDDAIMVSAKTGEGVDDIFRKLVEKTPAPSGDPDKPLRALVFDCVYNDFRGVIVHARIMDGEIRTGDRIRMMNGERDYEVSEIGRFMPAMKKCDSLSAGEVGYVIATIRSINEVKVGDTITHLKRPAAEALPGYREPKPMVFCGMFPTNPKDYTVLRDAFDKLKLNDSAFTFEPENSEAMGFGFRCGFLGLLHMDVVQERLEREFQLDLVQTAPNVTYVLVAQEAGELTIDSPAKVPAEKILEWREPYARVTFIMPREHIGSVMTLCEDRRGTYRKTEYVGAERVVLEYEMPLAEIIFDLHDTLKSATSGYGSMDYEFSSYKPSDLTKVEILVNKDPVSSLSFICHRETAERKGRAIIKRLRKEIPRHQFEIALQAAIGSKVIARETIRALRKDVTAKCYGGDITRKRKLLEKQKEGKRRMKQIGNVQIPQKAFMAVLSIREDE